MSIDRVSGGQPQVELNKGGSGGPGGAGFASTLRKQESAKQQDVSKEDAAKAQQQEEAAKARNKDDAKKTEGKKKPEEAEGKDKKGKTEKKEGKEGTERPEGETHGRVERHGKGKGDGEGKAGEGEGEGKSGELGGKTAGGRGKVIMAERGKAEVLEAGNKKGELGKVLDGKGKEAERAVKQDRSTDLERDKRIDKAGAADAGQISKKDDKKSMQQEIAKNLAPGMAPPLFLQSQLTQVDAPKEARPVIAPEIVDKIVQNARFGMTADGAHEFHIDLKDDVYGGSQLKIQTKDGKVTINIIADDTAAASSFFQKADDMAKQLSAKGLNVAGVNIMTKAEAEAAAKAATARPGAKRAAEEDEGDWLDRKPRGGRDYQG